jgi:hypothetical protein
MNFGFHGDSKPGFSLENLTSLTQDVLLQPPSGQRGFQDYPEAPRILFDKKAGSLPRDFELFHDYWLVSDRTKSVFEAVDPAGFAFLACDVRLPRGDYDGPFSWLCDVIRVLDALDEARSRLVIAIEDDKRSSIFGEKYYHLGGHDALVFRDGAIGDDAIVFRMAYMPWMVICDQTMRDACKAAGLKGIKFDDASKL